MDSVVNTVWNIGEIDKLAALIASVREVIEAFGTMLYLIGKLFGG